MMRSRLFVLFFAAALNQGIISDDLRNRAFQTCGEMADADATLLHYMWMVLSSRTQGSPRAACTELDVPSARYMAPQVPVGGVLWSRSLSWGNCLRKRTREKALNPSGTILEASNNSFLLAFGALFP